MAPASIIKEGEEIDVVKAGEAKAFPRINPRTQRQEDVTLSGIEDGFTVWDGKEVVGYRKGFGILGAPFTNFELTEGRTAVAVLKR